MSGVVLQEGHRLLCRYLLSQALGTDYEVEYEVPLAVATAISGDPDAPRCNVRQASWCPTLVRVRVSTSTSSSRVLRRLDTKVPQEAAARAMRQLNEAQYAEAMSNSMRGDTISAVSQPLTHVQCASMGERRSGAVAS
uniref:Uncharacterized protein n=1 Tax=Rhodosorus marinus TaxID=101924 RepID=A0A7S2ZUB8_9RHOD